MTTLKLLNHSENTPEERMTADVIMRGYANPDELMKKTIEAAKQREKENAAKNARKKKVTMRIAAVAALVMIVLACTPAGGYVVSAAESALHAFKSWLNGAFSVTMKQTENDCTIEIVEARVSGNFLYLMTAENFDKVKSDLSEKYEEYFDIMTFLSGKIYDNKGNSCDILDANTRAGEYGDTVLVTEAGRAAYPNIITEYGDERANEYVRTYQIFIPHMEKVINSDKKKVYCKISIDVQLFHDKYKSEQLARMNFEFPIKLSNDAIALDEYKLNYSYTVGDMKFDFKKLSVFEHSSSIMVELIPLNDLANYHLTNKDGRLLIEADAFMQPKGYKHDNDPCGLVEARFCLNYPAGDGTDNLKLLDHHAYSGGPDTRGNAVNGGYNQVFEVDGKYYFFLTDFEGLGVEMFFGTDYEGLIQELDNPNTDQYFNFVKNNIEKDYEFCVMNLSYEYVNLKDNREYSGVVCCKDAWIDLESSAKKKKFKEMRLSKKDWEGLYDYEEEDGSVTNYATTEYTTEVGDMTLSVSRVFSVLNQSTGKNEISVEFDYDRIDEKSHVDEINCIKCRFAAIKNGKVIACTTNCYDYAANIESWDFKMNTGDVSQPDAIVPIHFQYRFNGKKITYYDPRYCNEFGLTKAEFKKVKKFKQSWADFKTHNTFTVSSDDKIAP